MGDAGIRQKGRSRMGGTRKWLSRSRMSGITKLRLVRRAYSRNARIGTVLLVGASLAVVGAGCGSSGSGDAASTTTTTDSLPPGTQPPSTTTTVQQQGPTMAFTYTSPDGWTYSGTIDVPIATLTGTTDISSSPPGQAELEIDQTVGPQTTEEFRTLTPDVLTALSSRSTRPFSCGMGPERAWQPITVRSIKQSTLTAQRAVRRQGWDLSQHTGVRVRIQMDAPSTQATCPTGYPKVS